MNTNKRKRSHTWQTWWSIIGPKLMGSEYKLKRNVVLCPLSSDEFERMKSYRAPVPTFTPSTDSFVAHYPPRDEIQSRHRLQIDVEADDQDEACRLAQQVADRLVVSLSLVVPGGRYHAELRKFRRADEVQEYSAWSQIGRVTPLAEPEYLDKSDIERILSLFDAAENDPTAENAYVHLLSAWQLHATAGSKPLQRSILQHYVLCIEAVVNGAMVKIRRDRYDKIRLAERTFAAEFESSLSTRSDKPEAIRQASTKLREISMSNMLPSIDVISDALGLPAEIKQQAKELYQFRSRNLSHPRRAEQEGLQQWLTSGPTVAEICRADAVARAFFVGYCQSISQSSKSR